MIQMRRRKKKYLPLLCVKEIILISSKRLCKDQLLVY